VLATARKPDLIIIPAVSGNLDEALKRNREFLPWIVDQYKDGSEVASLCIGAFLFAETGLLSGNPVQPLSDDLFIHQPISDTGFEIRHDQSQG